MQPALQCGYCDNSGNYITKFKENIRTRGNKITPVQRGRKAEIRPYRRFLLLVRHFLVNLLVNFLDFW